MLHEHTWSSSVPVDGYHREGSFKAYYSDTEPIYRPDGETELGVNDYGRFWYKPIPQQLFHYSDSGFVGTRLADFVTFVATFPQEQTLYTALDSYISTIPSFVRLRGAMGSTDKIYMFA
jgi:hypothetical protein